jgi:O-antigen/teichoic acid export membrane protein
MSDAQVGDPADPSKQRHRSSIAWGFVDQGFSSATNFGLSLLAGRLLGPAGLGEVFIGFSAYLLTLGILRRLLTEPLVAASAAGDDNELTRTASHGIALALAAGAASAIGVAFVGLIIPGFVGTGLLLIAPWLLPALVQDYWRNQLFRDRRAAAAAANDGAWLLAMLLAVPLAWEVRTTWAVVCTWGSGALAAMMLGFLQTKVRSPSPAAAWRWWARNGWPFGRWNAGAGIVADVTANASAFVISAILGASALGGIRAAQSVFAPLTLIIPAITLPGLPIMTRALASDPARARRLAWELSGLALAVAASYVAFMVLGGWRLLPVLFGSEFTRFRDLIWPIAAAQTSLAIGLGFVLLIKAQRRGRALLFARMVGATIALGLIWLLASLSGVLGAAWGGAIGSIIGTIVLVTTALRRHSRFGHRTVRPTP